MADQKAHHPAEANGYTRSDREAGSDHSAKELKKKKRMKILLYVVLFIVFQTAVITLFALTIMKFRTPKFRIASANSVNLETTPSSFNASFNAELTVKNTNFGHFRYRETTLDIYLGDTVVGNATVEKGRAKWRSTRRINVVVVLAANNPQLANAISSGVLTLRAESHVRGRVTIMFIMKKKKSANLNCTMNLITRTKEIQNLECT